MATQAEKDQVVTDATAVVTAAQTALDHANALVVDTTDVAALQQQVADLTAQNATLTQQLADATALADSAVSERDKARDQITRMLAKLDAIDAADVTEDQARADIRGIAAE